MKLVIDMNLSPEWVPIFREHGIEAVHWSAVGDPRAADAEIMQWARDHETVVFTHDLDFGIILAHTKVGRPSVIQVRTQDVSPPRLGKTVLTRLRVMYPGKSVVCAQRQVERTYSRDNWRWAKNAQNSKSRF